MDRKGSSESVMGEKRVSWNADIRAYSERALERGKSEKLPMQPRRLYC